MEETSTKEFLHQPYFLCEYREIQPNSTQVQSHSLNVKDKILLTSLGIIIVVVGYYQLTPLYHKSLKEA